MGDGSAGDEDPGDGDGSSPPGPDQAGLGTGRTAPDDGLLLARAVGALAQPPAAGPLLLARGSGTPLSGACGPAIGGCGCPGCGIILMPTEMNSV